MPATSAHIQVSHPPPLNSSSHGLVVVILNKAQLHGRLTRSSRYSPGRPQRGGS